MENKTIEWKRVCKSYLVSNEGKVFSELSNKELVPWETKKGYLRIDMGRKKRVYVHRLVAETFLDNPENKATVNHINHNKKDNSVSNLEWATYKEQTEHDFRMGKRKTIRRENGRFAKTSES